MKKYIRFCVYVILFTPALPFVTLLQWISEEETTLTKAFSSTWLEYKQLITRGRVL